MRKRKRIKKERKSLKKLRDSITNELSRADDNFESSLAHIATLNKRIETLDWVLGDINFG